MYVKAELSKYHCMDLNGIDNIILFMNWAVNLSKCSAYKEKYISYMTVF